MEGIERLTLRFNVAKRAFNSFKEALALEENTISRDVSLLRFQYAVEAIWKLAQHFLREKEGLDINSPKSSIRGSLQQSLITESDANLLLEIMDARNLIVHTYNEELAENLYEKLPNFSIALEHWILTISKRLWD